MNRWRSPALLLTALTLLADLALLAPPLRYTGAVCLLWLLPGLAWSLRLADGRWPRAEETLAGLGLGLTTTALLALLLSYLPGPFTGWGLAVATNLTIVGLAWSAGARHEPLPSLSLAPVLALLVLLLVAAPLRLVNLGYSEFQGDEGVIMLRAAAILTGNSDTLFLHQKGPLEVLLPTATWSLSGTINEPQARLPFALASLLGVGAVALLGTRLFNRRVGLLGGLILAINGYFVAFARIVQYQSLVLALTGTGLLALWLWRERGQARWLLAGSALLAGGLLAHYDAALVLPAAAYVVWRGMTGAGRDKSRRYGWYAAAAAVALIVLALFYLPFALHPNFAKTLAYLRAERVGTGGPLHNNLLTTLPLTTLYNSTCYIGLIALLLLIAALRPFRRWGWIFPVVCLGALVAALRWQPLLVGPVCAVGLAVPLLSRRTPPGMRAAWLWFAAPFLFYYFLVWDPRTHVLNIFPAASLLAAVTVDGVLRHGESRRDPSHPYGAVGVVCAVLVFLVCGYYPWMLFVDHTPEIQRTWPQHRSALYWTPYDELPRYGLFGFPHQAGWRALGALLAPGESLGVYGSNEEEEVTRWYTQNGERTYCPGPDAYLIAERVQDEMPVDATDLMANYHLAGVVTVDDEPRLRLYRPGPATGEPVTVDAGHLALNLTPQQLLPHPPTDITPVGALLGGQIRLVGYRLDTRDAHPGGLLRLTLYWEPLAPLRTSYQVFTHLYSDRMLGQHDSAPGCGLWPTTRWEPGHLVRDDHWLPIVADAPAGEAPLWVGMYLLGDGRRLPVTAADGTPLGDALLLTTVRLP